MALIPGASRRLRSGLVGTAPSSFVPAAVGWRDLIDSAAWRIAAASGTASNLIEPGTADPTPLTASLIDPADGAIQVVSLDTNEAGDGVTSTGSYLWTADSAANSVTGDIDIRALCRAIDDATNDGAVPQTVKVAKYLGDAVNTFDYLASILTDGDLRLGGSGLSATVAASESMYGQCAYRWTRVSSTGVFSAYVEDDDNPDVTTADGRNWRLLGTDDTISGDLDDTTNAILTFMVGKGVGGWCQVYDGIDGTLVVDMDIARDATAGLTSGDTFTAETGETWTLNEKCATFAVDRKAWVVGATGETADGPFTVPDADALDIGTGDFTVACLVEPSVVSTGAFGVVLSKVDAATLGTTAHGWGFFDYSPYGGAVFGMNDGGGFVSAGAPWTGGERHLLVATGDRDGLLSLYIDDMTTPAVTTDISDTTGTLANTDDLSSSCPDPALLVAAAKWDRVLTADELRKLPDLMETY